jgi:hypothetical protein
MKPIAIRGGNRPHMNISIKLLLSTTAPKTLVIAPLMTPMVSRV